MILCWAAGGAGTSTRKHGVLSRAEDLGQECGRWEMRQAVKQGGLLTGHCSICAFNSGGAGAVGAVHMHSLLWAALQTHTEGRLCKTYLLFVCVHVHDGTCVEVRGQPVESVLFLALLWGSGDWIQVIRRAPFSTEPSPGWILKVRSVLTVRLVSWWLKWLHFLFRKITLGYRLSETKHRWKISCLKGRNGLKK